MKYIACDRNIRSVNCHENLFRCVSIIYSVVMMDSQVECSTNMIPGGYSTKLWLYKHNSYMSEMVQYK